MGKVTVTFRATNYDDLSDFARKRRKTRPRAIEAEALVDTGARASTCNAASSRRWACGL